MKKLTKGNSVPSDQSDKVKLLENSSGNLAYRSFEKEKATDRLHQILPAYHHTTKTPIKQTAKAIRFILLATIPVVLMVCLTALLFVGYRASGDFETFWHHLKENKTFAVSLSDDKTLQDVAVEDVLARLESADKLVHQKLAELAAVGYD